MTCATPDTSKSQPTAYCFAQLKQGTCLIRLKYQTGRNTGVSLCTTQIRLEPYCKTVKQKKRRSSDWKPPLQRKQVAGSSLIKKRFRSCWNWETFRVLHMLSTFFLHLVYDFLGLWRLAVLFCFWCPDIPAGFYVCLAVG